MPRVRKTPAIPNPTKPIEQTYAVEPDAGWGGFINVRLGDEDHDRFSQWWSDHAVEVQGMFEDALGAGLKITFAYDAENQCFVCSWTGRLVSASKDRFCVTSRAGTLNEALALSVWKHVAYAHGDYSDYSPKERQLRLWG